MHEGKQHGLVDEILPLIDTITSELSFDVFISVIVSALLTN